MNIIQKALEMQDISVGWCGDEPTTAAMITKVYLEGVDQYGYPRVVRASMDLGNVIKIGQLKEDYKTLLAEHKNTVNNKEIQQLTKDIILRHCPMYKQINLQSRFNILQQSNKPTKAEKDEIKHIYAVWEWIELVRDTVKKSPKSAKWPEYPEK